MKKLFAISGVALLLAACAKTPEENAEPAVPQTCEQECPDFKVSLSISLSGCMEEEPSTKAYARNSYNQFMSGDAVWIFFKGVAAPKYLELKVVQNTQTWRNSWVATPMNGLSAADLSASGKTMTALFLPYRGDAAVTADGTGFQIESGARSGLFYRAEQVPYTFDGNELQGTILLEAPSLNGSDKYVHFDVSGVSMGEYTFYQEYVKPMVCTGVSASGEVEYSIGQKGQGFSGYLDQNAGRVCASGVLDAWAVGRKLDYRFAVDYHLDAIWRLLTRCAKDRTLSKSTYVGLGSLRDQWIETFYVDLGIRNAAGERVCWAVNNLGAGSSLAPGLYWSFLATEGHSFIAGQDNYAFSPSLWMQMEDMDDPATATLGYPWRSPLEEEWQALLYNTDNQDRSFMPGKNGGMTFTSTVPGYTDQSIFLPAAGYVCNDGENGTASLHDKDSFGHYWTHSYASVGVNSKAPSFSFSNTGEVWTSDSQPVYYGLSVRPVFTLPGETAGTVSAAPRILPERTTLTIPGYMNLTPGYINYTIENPVPGAEVTVEEIKEEDYWINIDTVTDTYVRLLAVSNPDRTSDYRTGTVTLQYPGASPVSITVNQYNVLYEYTVLEVPQTEFEVSDKAASYAIPCSVTRPVEGASFRILERDTLPSWLTVRIDENNSIFFTVAENTKTQSRSYTFTIKYSGARAVREVTVTQAGKPAGPPDIDLSGMESHNQIVATLGEDFPFYARLINPVGGVSLEMKSDASWITNIRPDQRENYFLFTATPNTTGKSRYGHIDFTYSSVHKRLNFEQEAGGNVIILNPGDLTFNYEGRSVSFDITLPDGFDERNLSLEPDNDYPFIRNLRLNGRKVSFDLRENNDELDRQANIAVRYGDAQSVFHLTQTYEAPVFSVSSPSVTLNYQQQVRALDIEVTNPRQGLTLSVIEEVDTPWLTSFVQDGRPSVNVRQNTSGASRSTSIRIGYGNYSLGSTRVNIVQTTSRTSFEVTPASLSVDAKGGQQTLTFHITDPLSGVEIGADSPASWIEPDLNSITNTTAKVVISKNYMGSPRNSSIRFTYGDLSFVVPVSQEAGSVPEGFVDLGLPSGTLWAEANLGAGEYYGQGTFYAWGETAPKQSYTWNNYAWGRENSLTKYNSSDHKTTLDTADDAAWQADHAWRIPTPEQFEELWDYCEWEWTLLPVPGYWVRSRVTDTAIFFPAAGYKGDPADDEWAGYYWTRSLNTTARSEARAMIMQESTTMVQSMPRYFGMPIRPVR